MKSFKKYYKENVATMTARELIRERECVIHALKNRGPCEFKNVLRWLWMMRRVTYVCNVRTGRI